MIGLPLPKFLRDSFSLDCLSGISLVTSERKDSLTLAFVLVLNIFLTPFLLVWHSIRIYIYPCIYGLLQNFVWNNFADLCPAAKFTDATFPATDASLGRDMQGRGVKWVRLQDLDVEGGKGKVNRLFDGVNASDIAQGRLGDCWLLAAFATLTEKAYLIENCFITR